MPATPPGAAARCAVRSGSGRQGPCPRCPDPAGKQAQRADAGRPAPGRRLRCAAQERAQLPDLRGLRQHSGVPAGSHHQLQGLRPRPWHCPPRLRHRRDDRAAPGQLARRTPLLGRRSSPRSVRLRRGLCSPARAGSITARQRHRISTRPSRPACAGCGLPCRYHACAGLERSRIHGAAAGQPCPLRPADAVARHQQLGAAPAGETRPDCERHRRRAQAGWRAGSDPLSA